MSLLSFLPLLGDILDRVIPDKNEAAKVKAELDRMHKTGELETLARLAGVDKAQNKVNEVEAAHSSVFVSGWRPYIGWVCGVVLTFSAFVKIILPAALIAVDWYNEKLTAIQANNALQDISIEFIISILAGMLGLGLYRTFERLKGVARNSLKEPQYGDGYGNKDKR